MSLRTWVSAERGRCARLARDINVHPVLVSQWASGRRDVPVEHCAAIEEATDREVRRWHLRPADWRRIWPEIAESAEAPQPTPPALAPVSQSAGQDAEQVQEG